jgi:DNA-binding transcriptional regulator YiaG
MYHYIDSGLSNVWLRNGYRTVASPYGKATAIEDLEGLHASIGRRLALEKPRLSGGEFRFLRKELGLSQAALAALLGNTEQAVAKWEKGARLPAWADRLLRQVYLEHLGGNQRLTDLLEQLAQADDTHDPARLVFFEQPRKGWVAQAA